MESIKRAIEYVRDLVHRQLTGVDRGDDAEPRGLCQKAEDLLHAGRIS